MVDHELLGHRYTLREFMVDYELCHRYTLREFMIDHELLGHRYSSW